MVISKMTELIKNQIEALRKNLGQVILGKDDVITTVLISLLGGGNILIEDVPGVGKTTFAKTLAQSIDGIFHRIQFTPDLLPSDIIGTLIYNPKDTEFHFRKGPVFANILLADEINRASPRTQSALLEAMNERQVTVEAITYKLPKPFLVIATENPVEHHGTYHLPEAQLDRFAMQIKIGYPDEDNETLMLYSRKEEDPYDNIKPVITCAQISELQEDVKKIEIEKSVALYMTRLIRKTREDARIKLGLSPRALLSLSRCAQAKAFIEGRKYVIPDDVKRLAVIVLAHRIMLESRVQISGSDKQQIIKNIVEKLDVPT
jgi:MoxR-like ATPase